MDFYVIEEKYYEVLSKYDKRVEFLKNEHYARPFIGELIKGEKSSYFAPLSSPKKKHRYLKENIDLIKIKRGTLGVINLNNMIPVPEKCQNRLIFSTIQNEKYRKLLCLQKEWIENHSYLIQKKAQYLYELNKKDKLDRGLEKRCCNFLKLEDVASNQNSILYFQEEKECYQCA